MRDRTRRRNEHGQLLVLFALALVAIIAAAGLLIDGSNVLAQQRVAQNGADAAATAGGLVIADGLDTKTTKTNAQVYGAIQNMAATNGLANWTAEYTDNVGKPTGVRVENNGAETPAGASGVRVDGQRVVGTSFSRVIGIDSIPASASATVLVGPTSTECVVAEDGCALLPLTFPVKTFQCDAHGNLEGGTWVGAPPPDAEPGTDYWSIVGMDALPTATNPNGDTSSLAILPLCKGSGLSTGTFGWLDLDPSIPTLGGEITGPLTVAPAIPDWFRSQPGNPNSVEDELMAYWHKPVIIPLHNQACRVDPGDTETCPSDQIGKDPTGGNTWYYVHTVAVFYIQKVLVQGSNVGECASPPGSPLVPVTTGTGFLGCLKGWFVKYIISGPINPAGNIESGAIGIQLIH